MLASISPGCRSKKVEFQTVEQAHGALVAAARAGDAASLFEMVDRSTSWSVMSLLRAKQRIHALVDQHYPADRRARELRRTEAAARARNAKDYFVRLATEQRLLQEIVAAGRIDAVEGDRQREATVRSADHRLTFCRGDDGWRFCGWRERFERLKVRASRDLLTVRENAETFQQGR